MIWSTTGSIMAIGIARPTPANCPSSSDECRPPVAIAVFMPMTRPP